MNFPDKLVKALEKIQHEPNWEDFEYKGYKCCIRRMVDANLFMGSLNGYVFVPKGHKLYGRNYFHDVEDKIDCHGGLTWSSEAEKLFPEIKDMWVYGFDCGHAYDLQPFYTFWMMMRPEIRSSTEYLANDPDTHYRDWEYVKNECKSIVDQMIKLNKNDGEIKPDEQEMSFL